MFLKRSFSYGKIHIFELWRTNKYHIYPTYLNTSGPCQTDSIIWNNFNLLSSCTKKNPGRLAIRIPIRRCVMRRLIGVISVCSNLYAWEYGKYGKYYSIYQHRVTWIVENSVICRHVVYASFYLYKCSLVRWPGASGFCYVLIRLHLNNRIGNISVRSPSNWPVVLISLLWCLQVCGYGVNGYCLGRRAINWFARNAGLLTCALAASLWTFVEGVEPVGRFGRSIHTCMDITRLHLPAPESKLYS